MIDLPMIPLSFQLNAQVWRKRAHMHAHKLKLTCTRTHMIYMVIYQ